MAEVLDLIFIFLFLRQIEVNVYFMDLFINQM